MTTLRETVMALPTAERLEYALSCWEMLTGQDEPPRRDIDGVILTEQQAQIFALLFRRIGRPVPVETIMAILDASRNEAYATIVLVRAQISHMRRRLLGKYRITCRYSDGYILEAVDPQG